MKGTEIHLGGEIERGEKWSSIYSNNDTSRLEKPLPFSNSMEING